MPLYNDLAGSNDSGAQDLLRTTQAKLTRLGAKDQAMRDQGYLRSVSLSQFMNEYEAAVHDEVHTLYASPIERCDPRNPEDLSYQCDDLGPSWSSPLNPYFWKLHLHIDRLIGEWLKANGKTEISTKCAGRPNCHQWTGTWLGTPPSGHHSH